MTNHINAKASGYFYPVDVYDAWLSGYEARKQDQELARSAKANPTSESTHRHVVIGFRYDYHYNSNRVVVSCDHIDCNESFEFPAPDALSQLPDVVGLYVIDHGWVNMPNDVANNTYWDS